jgi:hypothetical protein
MCGGQGCPSSRRKWVARQIWMGWDIIFPFCDVMPFGSIRDRDGGVFGDRDVTLRVHPEILRRIRFAELKYIFLMGKKQRDYHTLLRSARTESALDRTGPTGYSLSRRWALHVCQRALEHSD